MTAPIDLSRVVRSWLREDEHESAQRVVEIVLARLDATPQRRSWWPAWRSPSVNAQTKALLAVAAAVVIAVVGYQFLPNVGGPGGRSSPTPVPSPTPIATPVVTPVVTPAPTRALVVPPAGPLAIGRHDLNLEGIHMTFEIATPGWISNGDFGFDSGTEQTPTGRGFIVWQDDADGIFSDPCNQVKAPKAGPTAGDMAAAIASHPGAEVVAAPTAMTIDGRPAQKVVVRFPDPLPCPPDQYYLWYDDTIADLARYVTAPGSTIRVWIIEVDGKRVQLDGETYAGADGAIGEELDAIVESIRFD
jgi:hypothetical protein